MEGPGAGMAGREGMTPGEKRRLYEMLGGLLIPT